MALPGGCFLVAMSLPKPVAGGGQKDDERADRAVHERVAEPGGDAAEQQGREADADVERPEIRRRCHAGARGRRALHGECLERGRERAEAAAEQRGRGEQEGEPAHLAEEQHAEREDGEARIDGGVRPLLVEAAADEGTCEDDDEGEYDEEEARLLLQAEALRVERDEREDAAVGEEDEAAEQRGREGARLDEIRQREATLPLRRGRCDRARQTARESAK